MKAIKATFSSDVNSCGLTYQAKTQVNQCSQLDVKVTVAESFSLF